MFVGGGIDASLGVRVGDVEEVVEEDAEVISKGGVGGDAGCGFWRGDNDAAAGGGGGLARGFGVAVFLGHGGTLWCVCERVGD